MKRLKFLIVVLGLFVAHGVMAVTLPSSSYSPYSFDEQSYSQSVAPSGVRASSGRILSLGDYSDVYPWTDHCATDYPGPDNIMACQNCVATDLNQCYSACSGDGDCMDWCDEMNYKYQGDCGRSLPLDAPLWFLLASIVILSAANYAASESRRQVYLDYAERSK